MQNRERSRPDVTDHDDRDRCASTLMEHRIRYASRTATSGRLPLASALNAFLFCCQHQS